MDELADFVEVEFRDHEQYLDLLSAIRPATARVDFVFPDGVAAGHPLVEQMTAFGPERSEGLTQWPGTTQRSPQGVRLSVAYDREVFRLLGSYPGLFRHVQDPRGDRIELTELGNVDLSCYDRDDRLIFYTVTHEGIARLSRGIPRVAASGR